MISGGNYFHKNSQRKTKDYPHHISHDVEFSTKGDASAGEDVQVEVPQFTHRDPKNYVL